MHRTRCAHASASCYACYTAHARYALTLPICRAYSLHAWHSVMHCSSASRVCAVLAHYATVRTHVFTILGCCHPSDSPFYHAMPAAWYNVVQQYTLHPCMQRTLLCAVCCVHCACCVSRVVCNNTRCVNTLLWCSVHAPLYPAYCTMV